MWLFSFFLSFVQAVLDLYCEHFNIILEKISQFFSRLRLIESQDSWWILELSWIETLYSFKKRSLVAPIDTIYLSM